MLASQQYGYCDANINQVMLTIQVNITDEYS